MSNGKHGDGSGKKGKFLYLVCAFEGFGGYDTFDSFVACADSEEEARKMHPSGILDENDVGTDFPDLGKSRGKYSPWVKFSEIHLLEVEKLGVASNQIKGVILASFNAG